MVEFDENLCEGNRKLYRIYKKMCTFVAKQHWLCMKKEGFWWRAFDLYYDGFRNMRLGKTLWILILVKLFIIFVVLKIFFFPNFLSQHAEKGEEDEFVAGELIERGDLQRNQQDTN